jgi:putative flippase GtrA
MAQNLRISNFFSCLSNRVGIWTKNLRQPLAFATVGVLNTIVGYLIILLGLSLGFGDYGANAAGYLIGLSISYALNRRWTFAATAPASLGEFGRFGLTALAAYTVNLSVIRTAHALGFIDNPIAQAAALTAYSIVFFLLSRYLVFHDNTSGEI